MRLFHFSERGDIQAFHPRAVEKASKRKPGREWLNGHLVWAIDDLHQPLHLFPRECPRILVWRVERSTAQDWSIGTGGSAGRMVGFVEQGWAKALREGGGGNDFG